jgi:hypothetical protein
MKIRYKMDEKEYKEIREQLDFYRDKYKLTDSLYQGVQSLITENKELKEKIEYLGRGNKKGIDDLLSKDKQ